MLWGLANLWKEGDEGGYAVQHSRQPVSDFGKPRQGEEGGADRPNYFEKAFPCLYPYGVGGPEADQPVEVDFRDHIKWSLDYTIVILVNTNIPFRCFWDCTTSSSLYSAHLQMRRKTFESDARLLSTITLESLNRPVMKRK